MVNNKYKYNIYIANINLYPGNSWKKKLTYKMKTNHETEYKTGEKL